MFKKLFLWCAFSLLLTVNFCAAEEEDRQALVDFLYNAKEVSQNSSFRAVSGDRIVFYQKALGEGKKPLLRRELLDQGWPQEIKIRNEDGWYLISQGVVYNDQYANFDWSPGAIITPGIIKDATIEKSSTFYDEIPVFKVTVRTPDDWAFLAERTKKDAQYVQENLESLREQYCYVYSFLIGQKDSFIYSTKTFSFKGKLLYELELKQVNFNFPLPDTLFTVSEELKEGGSFATQEEMEKAFSSPKQSLFSKNFLFNTAGKVALCVGIAACIFAAVRYFKKKRS